MSNPRQLLTIVVVLGLVARVLFVIWYPQQPVALDAEGYDRTGLDLATTGHYSVSGRATPLYPVFLAGVYVPFGHSYGHVRIAQAVLVSVTALFAFLLGRSLFGEPQGLIAAALVSWYPGFFAYSGLLLTETVFTLLIVAFTWCLVQAWRRGGTGWAVASGAVLGAAALCRGEIIGLAVPAAALLAWTRDVGGLGPAHRHGHGGPPPRQAKAAAGTRPQTPAAARSSWPARSGVREAAVFLVVTAIMVAPWAVRQYANRDQGVIVTGGIGATLWLSTHPGDWQEWYADREPLRSLLDCHCTGDELERRLTQAAIRNVIESPGQYAWMSAKRFARFWIGSHSHAIAGLEASFQQAIAQRDWPVFTAKALLAALNMGFLFLAAVGMYSQRAAWPVWAPGLLVIGYVNLVHVGLFSTSRYQLPVIPLAAVFAACASERLVAGLRVRKVV